MAREREEERWSEREMKTRHEKIQRVFEQLRNFMFFHVEQQREINV